MSSRTGRLLGPVHTVRRILPILWESAHGWSVVTAVLTVLEISFGLLSLYLIKGLVDSITTLLGDNGQATNIEPVMWQVIAFGAATLAYLISRGMANLAREAQGMAVADHVERMIHSRAVAADLAFYESPRYFDTLHRARQSGSQRPAQVTGNILLLAKNLIMLAAVVVLLASINWLLLPILLFAIVPALIVRVYFTRALYDWRRRRTPLERRAAYLDWLMTSDLHAKELRINQLGEYLKDLHSRIRGKVRLENLRISKRRTVVEVIVGATATIIFFAALAYLAWQTAEGHNTVGDLVLFLLIFQRAQSMGQEIVTQISKLYEDHLYIGLLFEFLDVEPGVISSESSLPLPGTLTPHVEVRGVSFSYPGSQETVLEDINLEIRPGQLAALVGANGSGKTSLIKLITRLYDPSAGRITIDGVDAREFDLDEYRRFFSVIFQDFSRYADTVRQNIRFGDIRADAESPSIVEAAQRAGADEFIAKLPKGYDTLLSRMFDEGVEISVGQWQKIALARAFMPGSRMIILDEPTSALDPNAEFELFENFKRRIDGRSALVISHRLSTVRLADFIYVMEGGRIVEQGTHFDLMQRDGRYRKAFERQGKYFQAEVSGTGGAL